MCACALDTEAAEGGDSDAGDEGGVGAAALLDALRDWFAEEFTAFLIEGEEAVGTVDHFKGMKSEPQLPLPLDRVTWSGQAVVAIVAPAAVVTVAVEAKTVAPPVWAAVVMAPAAAPAVT